MSPVATPLSDPFTPQSDETETDVILPPIKSPTQKSRPRRRSSAASTASPSVPSPAPIEHPKPSSVRQRRQSLRKQQQVEIKKEKQQEERLRQRGSQSSSFDQGDMPVLPGSPPTPTARLPSLMTTKGLMVTASDLDQLFDTDEEEGAEDHQAAPGTNHSSHNNLMIDGLSNTHLHQSMPSTGIVASTDLARMFPTPPSLEPISHSPPSVGTDYVSPGSVKTLLHGTSPEAHHMMQHFTAEGEHEKLLSPKVGICLCVATLKKLNLFTAKGEFDETKKTSES